MTNVETFLLAINLISYVLISFLALAHCLVGQFREGTFVYTSSTLVPMCLEKALDELILKKFFPSLNPWASLGILFSLFLAFILFFSWLFKVRYSAAQYFTSAFGFAVGTMAIIDLHLQQHLGDIVLYALVAFMAALGPVLTYFFPDPTVLVASSLLGSEIFASTWYSMSVTFFRETYTVHDLRRAHMLFFWSTVGVSFIVQMALKNFSRPPKVVNSTLSPA